MDDLPSEDDYWRWNIRRNPRKVAANLQAVGELVGEGGTATDLRARALRHVLAKPGVASAIVGHRSTDEVSENLGQVLAK